MLSSSLLEQTTTDFPFKILFMILTSQETEAL